MKHLYDEKLLEGESSKGDELQKAYDIVKTQAVAALERVAALKAQLAAVTADRDDYMHGAAAEANYVNEYVAKYNQALEREAALVKALELVTAQQSDLPFIVAAREALEANRKARK